MTSDDATKAVIAGIMAELNFERTNELLIYQLTELNRMRNQLEKQEQAFRDIRQLAEDWRCVAIIRVCDEMIEREGE